MVDRAAEATWPTHAQRERMSGPRMILSEPTFLGSFIRSSPTMSRVVQGQSLRQNCLLMILGPIPIGTGYVGMRTASRNCVFCLELVFFDATSKIDIPAKSSLLVVFDEVGPCRDRSMNVAGPAIIFL